MEDERLRKIQDRRLTALLITMVVLGAVIMAHDVWDVVAGDVNVNEYIPFLLPAALLVFILITLRIKKELDAREAESEEGDDARQ